MPPETQPEHGSHNVSRQLRQTLTISCAAASEWQYRFAYPEYVDGAGGEWQDVSRDEFREAPKRQSACWTPVRAPGSGRWTMVIGVDLSNIQPKWTPPNLTWELDDLEQNWTWSQPFDFIFVRMLAGSLKNYQDFINQAFENLEPGGYLEMQDLSLPYRCDDASLAPDSPIHKLSDLFLRGGRVTGRNMDAAPTYAALMRTAGFVDVEEHQFKWPVNAWPRDPHFKTLGAYTHCNLDHGLEGLTLGLATRNLGWSKEETLLFCATIRCVRAEAHGGGEERF
ncbi:TAM domain methyltransferase [Colletotrichum acutatum]